MSTTKGSTINLSSLASSQDLQQSIQQHLRYTLAHAPKQATLRDWWLSTSLAIRDRIMDRLVATQDAHNENNVRRLYYLSMEYLMGRMLRNNVHNLGLEAAVCEATQALGLNWDELCEQEVDMGLGNGGLGRLAACFLDSLATLDLPAVGYGIY